MPRVRAQRPATTSKRRPAPDTPARVRRAVHDRDGGCCRCGRRDGALHVHHRQPRGVGGRVDAHRLSAVLLLCAEHHLRWVELERDEARRLGFLVPTGTDPATWPVHAWDGVWLLDDHGDRTPTEVAA